MFATLNLLSPQKKVALRAVSLLAFTRTLLLLIFTVSAFSFFTLLAVRMMLIGTRDDLASRSALVESELGTVTAETRQINDYISRIEGIQNRFKRWSTFFVTVTGLIPDDVTLEEIRVEGDSVALSGMAATREDVQNLEQGLRKSGLFRDVKFPLSNILQPRNVKFEFQLLLVEPIAAPKVAVPKAVEPVPNE